LNSGRAERVIMGLNPEQLDFIRTELAENVLDFIKNPTNNNRILLVSIPQGLGKTITLCKTLLFDENILTVLLTYEHKQMEDILGNPILAGYYLFHLKGRDQLDENGNPLCTHTLYNELQNYNIDIKEFLCNPIRCKDFEQCKYLKQFNLLDSNIQCWGGVHPHLNTEYPHRYMMKGKHNYPYRCIVIDENPTPSLFSEVKFDNDDLDKLAEVLCDVSKHLTGKSNYCERKAWRYYEPIMAIISALMDIIEKTEVTGIDGIQFVEEFISSLKNSNVNIEEIDWMLKCKDMGVFIEMYKNELFKRFISNNKEKYVKNILYDILRIAKKCLYYYKYENEKDINLPFYAELLKTQKDGQTYERKQIVSVKVQTDLPDVPVIILDATGDKEFYEQKFNREVIEYHSSIHIERNIIQITDGMYYAKSLRFEHTRARIYNAVCELVKHHHMKGDGIVNIVIQKKYATIRDETDEYLGMSIERYLKQNNVDTSKVRIRHYGDVKGKNDMQNDKTIILVDTPEPNIDAFPKQVGCWYEGDEKINTERIAEPLGTKFHRHDYRYKDKRYDTHIKQIREHEIEQDIERLRFALSEDDKVAYAFSMIPIRFETKKTTINELLLNLKSFARFRQWSAHISVLNRLTKGRGKTSHQILSNATRYLKDVKDAGGLQSIIDKLLLMRVMEETGKGNKRAYQFTPRGRYWYEFIKEIIELN